MENFYEYIIPVARNFLKRLIAINDIRLSLLHCKYVFIKKLIYSINMLYIVLTKLIYG